MRSLWLAIAALLGMSSFAEAQPPCRPIEWCAYGNWLDKHCWCYRRGPQWWGGGGRWNRDRDWRDEHYDNRRWGDGGKRRWDDD